MRAARARHNYRSVEAGCRSRSLGLRRLDIGLSGRGIWRRAAPLAGAGRDRSLQPSPSEGGAGEGPFGFLTGISKSDNLLGDMWGLRPLLSKYGISFAVSETSEVLGNVTGGVQAGLRV